MVGIAGATGIAYGCAYQSRCALEFECPTCLDGVETEVPFLFARGSPLVWALVVPSRTLPAYPGAAVGQGPDVE